MRAQEIRAYYENAPLDIPSPWKKRLSRKHFRIETFSHKFVKLNRFENRLNERELKKYLIRFVPLHCYFSVLDWLFPERVGKKYKGRYAVPIGGEYVVDIDFFSLRPWHSHHFYGRWRVCEDCLSFGKHLTLEVCELIEENYSEIGVVFSGRRGYHVHVFDFDFKDWTTCRQRDPIKSHEAARFKYTKHLASGTHVFNRSHFTLSVDPMRIVSLPNSLNATSGLMCLYIGDRRDLDKLKVRDLVEAAKPTEYIQPAKFVTPNHAHPEPCDALSTPLCEWLGRGR